MSDPVKVPVQRKSPIYLKRLAEYLLDRTHHIEGEWQESKELFVDTLTLINKLETVIRKSISLSAAARYMKDPLMPPYPEIPKIIGMPTEPKTKLEVTNLADGTMAFKPYTHNDYRLNTSPILTPARD